MFRKLDQAMFSSESDTPAPKGMTASTGAATKNSQLWCTVFHFICQYAICDLADNNILSLTPSVLDFPFPLVHIILHQYHITQY